MLRVIQNSCTEISGILRMVQLISQSACQLIQMRKGSGDVFQFLICV